MEYERLLGVETEYSFSLSSGAEPDSDERQSALERFLEIARTRFPSLPGTYMGGLFLSNGARLYVDCGFHPEFSTPECTTPAEVVKYIEAGDRIVGEIASALQAESKKKSEVVISRANVDYNAGATWGFHESYLHRAEPRYVAEQIIPHLVSRIVYGGAGGFDNTRPGVEFTISPRVPHLVAETSSDSTGSRGIVHTKDEPLCEPGFHRLHLLCGERLCSQRATWLRLGTTALVVAMIEAKLQPGDEVRLKSPLSAMRTFALDPTCKAVAPLVNGTSCSAIAIQRHYLEHAERHLCNRHMPVWADDVCRQWRVVLDSLERDGPRSVSAELDWAIKLEIFKDRASRRGFAWHSLGQWNHRAVSARKRAGHAGSAEQGELHPFLKLRHELCELDTRFGQLGDAGVFSQLDRSGVLSHRLFSPKEIADATLDPPVAGRARLRGEAIREIAKKSRRGRADWQAVWDAREAGRLDLSDPFVTTPVWIEEEEEGGGGGIMRLFWRRLPESFRRPT